jgi:dTDP-glucose 4,6-dehydratase
VSGNWFTRKRVVITGGAGFLGGHLCERLLKLGADVICIDNLLTGREQNISHLVERAGLQFIRADVSERLRVPGHIDVILHFASPASPSDYLRLPIETLQVGAMGTWNALILAREKRARFVLASTSEVYGDPQLHPQREDYWGNVNPVGPRGVYDEAKRYAEALTTAFRSSHEVETVIVRIFNTYGPRMRLDDGRAIPNFIRQALCGDPVTVTGTGSQTRSICYIDDTVEGILRALEVGVPGPINIGNPDERSVLSIAQDVIKEAGSQSRVVFIERPVDDPAIRCPDTTLARSTLGWIPKVSWSAGLSLTISWFRQQIS